MWKYIKPYLHFAVIAALFMEGEVLMELIQPGIMSRIVDEGVLGLETGGMANLSLVWSLGLEMIILVLFSGFCGSMNNVFVHLSSQNIGNEIRKDCFRNIMTFSFKQLDRFGTGSLITRVTNDITQIQLFLASLMRGAVRICTLTFGSIFCIFSLNRKFGWVILCVLPLIVGCLVFCLIKSDSLFSKLQAQLDNINSIMQEDVSGIRIIKACVREIYEKARFGKANGALIRTQIKVLVIFAFMNPFISALLYAAVAVILSVSSLEVEKGMTTPGDIMAAITYTTQLLNGIFLLVMLFQNITRGAVSWKRVREILSSRPDLRSGPVKAGDTEQKGEIEFRNVSFSYPGCDYPVLKKISFTVHKGETVAIMGTTGCGKTSLVNLIPRFYDVTEGAVLVDGIDVREYDQQILRGKIAFTLQKSELFSGTIRENILWGNPEASGSEMESAARTAQAEEFIQSFVLGYDTEVAERGMSLSGGQRQRLSIARTVLKSSEILIFDDSTSALDLKTEADLYAALHTFSPDSTKFIVAQRIASVRRADKIIVLENGTISACGSHKELLESCSVYQDIYHSQIGGEILSV